MNKKLFLKYIPFAFFVSLSLNINANAENECLVNPSFEIMCSLGMLQSGDVGNSYANGVSANGQTVLGYADSGFGDLHTFIWRSGDTRLTDLGTLKSDNSGNSFANAISADGLTVVGQANNDFGDYRAFIWRSEDARMIDLGTLRSDNSGESSANAVSANGQVIVGQADNDLGTYRAFVWLLGDTNVTDLGTLKSDNSGSSFANGVSKDGSSIIGQSVNDSDDYHAFIWRLGDVKMTDLGTLKTDNSGGSRPVAISDDGSVVVGEANNDFGDYRAFIWRSEDAIMIDLGTLRSDNTGDSYANSVSGDGSTVVGYAGNDFGDYRAFIWRLGDTKVTDLGTIKSDNTGNSFANAVSSDGSTVVGQADNDLGNYRAFIWRFGDTKVTDLGTLKSDNSGNSLAIAVSADGSTIVGSAESDSGGERAFVWRANRDNGGGNGDGGNGNGDGGNGNGDGGNGNSDGSEDGNGKDNGYGGFEVGVMQDMNNLFGSYDRLANQTELAIRLQQRAMRNILNQGCFPGNTGSSCIKISGAIINSASNQGQQDLKTARSIISSGVLSYGYGVTEQLAVGAMISIYNTDLKNTEVYLDNGFGLGLFGRYSQGGSAHTGWQAELDLGYGTQRMNTVRGQGLRNVQYGNGRKDLDTLAVQLAVSYGFLVENDWLITPSINVKHYHSRRGSYLEKGLGLVFSTEYNQLRNNNTVAGMSLIVEKSLDERSRIQTGLGVDIDLKVDAVELSGQTDVFTLGSAIKSFSASASLKRNRIRPYVQLGYRYDLSSLNGVIGADLRASITEYGKKTVDYSLGLNYSIKF